MLNAICMRQHLAAAFMFYLCSAIIAGGRYAYTWYFIDHGRVLQPWQAPLLGYDDVLFLVTAACVMAGSACLLIGLLKSAREHRGTQQ